MSYDCELTGNLAQWNEKKNNKKNTKPKNPDQETNVNQSYQETDDTNEQNERTCADRLQMQNTLTSF